MNDPGGEPALKPGLSCAVTVSERLRRLGEWKLMPPTFRAFPQKLSDTLVNVEGKKRVSEDRFTEAAEELNPFRHRTCSCLACC